MVPILRTNLWLLLLVFNDSLIIDLHLRVGHMNDHPLY